MFLREVSLDGVGTDVALWQELEGDVGCVVWDAAIVLTKFLEVNSLKFSTDAGKSLINGRTVLELGSGTGCVGLAAAIMGASKVTITDLPEFLSLMEKNITENGERLGCPVEARELSWGNEEQIRGFHEPDVVLVADCIYYEQSLEPLVSTLHKLCGPDTTVLLSYEERTTGNKPQLQRKFFEMMDEHFRSEKIALEEQHELFRCEDIHIYKFSRR
ncbi:protein-lysine methyltransferase METTL21D-like [Penaeus japonicus]|uniref:protein-lysine methyltransferase METTL21D-like n=1 Tax=Penaeus japonicus TaxID=27405 RepID=UPI001C716365|nr:protein-lysine methyltransferase METTL21D-like [Penaeus japonicus]